MSSFLSISLFNWIFFLHSSARDVESALTQQYSRIKTHTKMQDIPSQKHTFQYHCFMWFTNYTHIYSIYTHHYSARINNTSIQWTLQTFYANCRLHNVYNSDTDLMVSKAGAVAGNLLTYHSTLHHWTDTTKNIQAFSEAVKRGRYRACSLPNSWNLGFTI